MAEAAWPPALAGSVVLHAAACAALAAYPAAWPGVLAGLAANHAVLAAAGMMPRSTLLGPNLSRLPPGRGAVALTFDDGPDPAVTPAVLALLAAAGAGASFFPIGARARRHPALMDAILRAGHGVENHTQTHPAGFAAMGPGGMGREIGQAQDSLQALGARPTWFRAPAGLRNPLLGRVLQRSGLHAASWTRRGFDTVSRDPATVLRRLLHNLADGDVLLLHDGNAARTRAGVPVVLAVLPALLAALAERGLSATALPAAGGAASPPPGGHAWR